MKRVLIDWVISKFSHFHIPKEAKQNEEWWKKSFGYHKVLMPIMLVTCILSIGVNTYYNGFNVLVMDSPISSAQQYAFYLNGLFFVAWLLFDSIFPAQKRTTRFDKQALSHHIVASTITISVFFNGGPYTEFAIGLILAETATYIDLVFPKRYTLKLYVAVFKTIGLAILVAHLDIGFLFVQKDYSHSTSAYVGVGLTMIQLILVFHIWVLRKQILKMKKYRRKAIQTLEMP